MKYKLQLTKFMLPYQMMIVSNLMLLSQIYVCSKERRRHGFICYNMSIRHFVKKHLKSRQKHPDFELSGFQMVGIIAIAIAKAGQFEIQPS